MERDSESRNDVIIDHDHPKVGLLNLPRLICNPPQIMSLSSTNIPIPSILRSALSKPSALALRVFSDRNRTRRLKHPHTVTYGDSRYGTIRLASRLLTQKRTFF